MKKILLNVKPFQETLHASMCGPASLKIVFDYYGLKKSEKELALLAGTNKDFGTDDKGISRAAKSLGFNCVVKNKCTFSDIEEWLKKGVPVIVDWFTRGRLDYSNSEVADGHLSVVIGLDDKSVYIQDPEIGKVRIIERNDFMKVWFDFSGEFIKSSELIVRQIIAIYK